jgi:hypothetical protein
MSKLQLTLKPTTAASKPDRAARVRELWRAAYRQSRSMIRDGGRYGYGARYVHCLGHLRRRFGVTGWPIAQKAASLAFDLRTVSKAATGTVAELHRQGMVTNTRRVCEGCALAVVPTRAVRVERAPRGLGWCWAFTFDELGSPNTARSLRRSQAKRMREDRARRAEVARAMAEDRRAIDGRDRYGLTVAGLFALRNAEAAYATA